jgi:adenine-specific DNA-methyltransferase
MDKLKMQSENLVEENVEKIATLFPNCITEGKNEKGETVKLVDFDLLKQELSKNIVEGNIERYVLSWPDKRKSILTANAPIAKTLRPNYNSSINFDSSQNVYIKGDNIDALKLLRETYLGKIKMIYIDPPYNTGTDTLPYSDDFGTTSDEYKAKSMEVVEGYKMVTNNSDNGMFHTDWLNMLYPRLKLAKDLLTNDGVIFISIDDHEAGNMKNICDEIFGSNNYVETFFIQVRYGEKSLNEKDNFQKLIEQVFIYAKDKTAFIPTKPYEEYDLNPFCWKITELGKGEEMMLGGKKVELFKQGQYKIEQVSASIDELKETWASGSVLKGNTSGKFFDKQLSTRVSIDGYGCLYKVDGIGEDGIGYRYFTGPKKKGGN